VTHLYLCQFEVYVSLIFACNIGPFAAVRQMLREMFCMIAPSIIPGVLTAPQDLWKDYRQRRKWFFHDRTIGQGRKGRITCINRRRIALFTWLPTWNKASIKRKLPCLQTMSAGHVPVSELFPFNPRSSHLLNQTFQQTLCCIKTRRMKEEILCILLRSKLLLVQFKRWLPFLAVVTHNTTKLLQRKKNLTHTPVTPQAICLIIMWRQIQTTAGSPS